MFGTPAVILSVVYKLLFYGLRSALLQAYIAYYNAANIYSNITSKDLMKNHQRNLSNVEDLCSD